MEELADLLGRSARGDRRAFRRFYDLTSEPVYALALARARVRGLRGTPLREAASHEVRLRFGRAWREAAGQAASGRSPLAWLLALEVGEPLAAVAGEAACA